MPMRVPVPCKHPGCGCVVPYGQRYCDKHKAMHPNNDSFTVRYFGNRTLIIRKELEKYLEEHPEVRRDSHGWKKFRSEARQEA